MLDLWFAVAAGSWRLNDREQPAARDAIDLDLGFTPTTRTLPLRRLDLANGAAGVARIARFDVGTQSLCTVEVQLRRRDACSYEQVDEQGEVAIVATDAHGLLLDVPQRWKRELHVERGSGTATRRDARGTRKGTGPSADPATALGELQ